MRFHLFAAIMVAVHLPLAAQQSPIQIGRARPSELARAIKTPQGPDERISTVDCEFAFEPSAGNVTLSSFASLELALRGGARSTGLHGFWDYQSNGGSPAFTEVLPGDWDRVYTVFQNALSGGTMAEIQGTNRAGYSVSTDGGTTWDANREVALLRTAFPALAVSTERIAYLATSAPPPKGKVLVFAAVDDLNPESFVPLGQMPVETATGRGERGVIWPSIALSEDGTRGFFAAAFSWTTSGYSMAPLQVGSMDLASGIGSPWGQLTDSLRSTSYGGRFGIVRSPAGRLGVAWYHPQMGLDDISGIYFSESTDNGTSWSSPANVLTDALVDGLLINGDSDTLTAGSNLDLAYVAEDLQVVATGVLNDLLRYSNIVHWSRANGLRIVAMSHQVEGMGGYSLSDEYRQANNGLISYPTISVCQDGKHIVVAYTAVDQRLDESSTELTSVANANGFLYYRLWGVGSRDGGLTWGDPFLIQDYAGEGTDSASIEYPSTAPVARMVDDNFELNLTFQAKRQPGGFGFVGAGQLAGEIQDVHQYFQRFHVTPEMFGTTSGVPISHPEHPALEITRLAPVPAGDRLAVGYLTSGEGIPHITVVDQLGRARLETRDESSRGPGVHEANLDVSALGAGMYQVIITCGDAVGVRPLNIVR